MRERTSLLVVVTAVFGAMLSAPAAALPVLSVVTHVAAADGDGDVCRGVTQFGTCVGTVLKFCADEGTPAARYLETDCAANVFPDGVAATCTLIDDVYGRDCAVLVDEPCAFIDPLTTDRVYGQCAVSEGACVLGAVNDDAEGAVESSVCTAVEGGPGCNIADIGSCADNLLQIDCSAAQRVFVDCTLFAGHCEAGACRDVPLDAACDAAGEGAGVRVCGDDLACVNNVCVQADRVCSENTFVARCDGAKVTLCDNKLTTTFDCVDVIGLPGTCTDLLTCTGEDCESPQGCVADVDDDGVKVCDVVAGLYCGPGESCIAGRYDGALHSRCETITGVCRAGETSTGCVDGTPLHPKRRQPLRHNGQVLVLRERIEADP